MHDAAISRTLTMHKRQSAAVQSAFPSAIIPKDRSARQTIRYPSATSRFTNDWGRFCPV